MASSIWLELVIFSALLLPTGLTETSITVTFGNAGLILSARHIWRYLGFPWEIKSRLLSGDVRRKKARAICVHQAVVTHGKILIVGNTAMANSAIISISLT